MIEVTDKDLRAVEEIIGRDSVAWDYVSPKEIIAAAYEVMRKKEAMLFDKDRIANSLNEVAAGEFASLSADTLAEAVKESLQSNCGTHFSPGGWQAIVNVYHKGTLVQRHISLDDNFPMLAATAVRQLAKQVR